MAPWGKPTERTEEFLQKETKKTEKKRTGRKMNKIQDIQHRRRKAHTQLLKLNS